MTLRYSLVALLLAVPFAASAQDVGRSIEPDTTPVAHGGTVGEDLRVSSVEVFQDRSPTPQRGSVVVVRYFMNDVQNVTANLNGANMPTLASPDGEVFEAVPRAENGPVADAVGQALSPQTAVFQIPLFASEDDTKWLFQVGTIGTGIQVVLQ